MAAAPGGAGIAEICSLGGVSGFRCRGRRPGRALPAVARLHGDGRAHLPAGRRLERDRGPAADAGGVGAVEGGRPAPDAGGQRADDGPERGRAAGAGAGLAAAGRRGGRVRRPLPDPRPPVRLRRGRRLGHRPRLGDERGDLQRPLRPRSVLLEGVLAADRHHDARRARRPFPFRFRADAGTGRDSLDGVLSGRRRRRHHRVRQLRPAGGRVVRGIRQRAVRAARTGRIRRRARQADLVPRMGPVPQLRQPGIYPGNARLDHVA